MFQSLVIPFYLFTVAFSLKSSVPFSTDKSIILDVLENKKAQSVSHAPDGLDVTVRILEKRHDIKEILDSENASTALFADGNADEPGLQKILTNEDVANDRVETPINTEDELAEKQSLLNVSQQTVITKSLNETLDHFVDKNKPSAQNSETPTLSTQNVQKYDQMTVIEKQIGDMEELIEQQKAISAQNDDELTVTNVPQHIFYSEEINIKPDPTENIKEPLDERNGSITQYIDLQNDKKGVPSISILEEITSHVSLKQTAVFDEDLYEESTSFMQDLDIKTEKPDSPNSFEEIISKSHQTETEGIGDELAKHDITHVQTFDDENISFTPPATEIQESVSTLNPTPDLTEDLTEEQSSVPSIIDAEETERTTPSVSDVGTTETPTSPVVLGIDGLSLPVKSYQTNHTLEEVFSRFGSIYGELLSDNYKRNFSLHDIQTSFKERHGVPGALNGKITVKQGLIMFNASFEMLEVGVTQVNEHAVIANYMFKDPNVRMLYRYLVEVADDRLSGVMVANFQDVEIYAPLIVNKNHNGTCNYRGYLFFYLEQSFKLRRSETAFQTEHDFKTPDKTKKAERIINSFITQRDVFRHINRVLFNVQAAEPPVGAEEEYRMLMKQHVCDLMI